MSRLTQQSRALGLDYAPMIIIHYNIYDDYGTFRMETAGPVCERVLGIVENVTTLTVPDVAAR